MELSIPPEELCRQIIGSCMKVHSTLGRGFVEFVYRNALLVEFRKANLQFHVEKPMKVLYEGVIVGEFAADLYVNDWLILELKAVSALTEEHETKMVNYLTALDQDFGLLINFGAKSLKYKRKYRRRKPPEPPDLLK